MHEHALKDLNDRLKSGSPGYDLARPAMDGIIGSIPQASAARREILYDERISRSERKKRLEALNDGEIRQRIDRHVASVQPIRERIEKARKERREGHVTESERQALENVDLVDGAAYFARRVLEGR